VEVQIRSNSHHIERTFKLRIRRAGKIRN